MKNKWQKLYSEIVFNHKWFRLRKDTVRLPSGKIIDDYILSERPDVVLIFGVTENNHVILVRQYKHAAEEIMLEFPGGFFDKDSELPENAAKRELLEETGYSCNKMYSLAQLVDNPTKDCNRTYLFVATGCKKTAEQNLDETEDIEVTLEPLNKLKDLIVNGRIYATLSVALGFLAIDYLDKKMPNAE